MHFFSYLCALFLDTAKQVMKIICFSKIEGVAQMVLKGDSSMLVNRKPFFIPDWSTDVRMTPCVVVRVSRLGKNISARFANRYYDAIAPGIDFAALDLLEQASSNGKSWSQALAFDYSLAIGEWTSKDEWMQAEKEDAYNGPWLLSAEQAIAEVSRWMTIRQGDLIYIQQAQPPQMVQPEQVLRATLNGEEKLYCKIK